MDSNQILQALEGYTQFFEDRGTPPVQHADEHALPCIGEPVLRHCHWMAIQAKQFLLSGRMGKANRWLGFIQAVLWLHGHYSLAELKEHNRP